MNKSGEYNKVYNFMKKKSDEIRNDWNDVPLWIIDAFVDYLKECESNSKKESILELAGGYLCAKNDVELQFMVTLIAKNSNQSELIDNIYGVDVWDNFSYQYSCRRFLKEIGLTNINDIQ